LEPLSNVIFSLYRGSPNHGQWVLACLEDTWPKLIGSRLALVCRPVQFENGKLSIEILDRDWDSVVKEIRADLTEKLQAASAGEVKSIVFSR
jgi:hypothetical protein